MSERRVSLAEYCALEPLKPTEFQTEQLYLSSFAWGGNLLLFIRQQGGMFSPDGFLVQVSPMRANICSAEASLSKTLHPYQLHGWMLVCSWATLACAERSIPYHNVHYYSWGFIKVHAPAVAFALSENDGGYTFVIRGHTYFLMTSNSTVLALEATTDHLYYATVCVTVSKSILISAYTVFKSLENIWLIIITQQIHFFMWQHVVCCCCKKLLSLVNFKKQVWWHAGGLVWIDIEGCLTSLYITLRHSMQFWIEVSTKWSSRFPSRLHYQSEYSCMKQNEKQPPLSISNQLRPFSKNLNCLLVWGVEG